MGLTINTHNQRRNNTDMATPRTQPQPDPDPLTPPPTETFTDAELRRNAPPEVMRACLMLKKPFEAELRNVVLTDDRDRDGLWAARWATLVHPAVIVRTMTVLSEFEHGLLKLTSTRRDDPNRRSWDWQLRRIRRANQVAKQTAGYFEPAPTGLGFTDRRSARQNFNALTELIARNEQTIAQLVTAIETWKAACEDDDIEFGDHDLTLLAHLDHNTAGPVTRPLTIAELGHHLTNHQRQRTYPRRASA